VGSGPVVAECKGYEDTKGWQFHETIEEARQSFSKTHASPVA
jgi:two-component system cell cycle response regulator